MTGVEQQQQQQHYGGIRLRINDLAQFINCIHDYIIDEFGIYPRDFETKLLVGDKALVWDQRTEDVCEIHCPEFNKLLHVHETYQNEASKPHLVMCCCEVDVIALRYLVGSIFDIQKSTIISTMHDWLPAATMHYVDAQLTNNMVRVISYFEPSYLFRFYDDDYNPGKSRRQINYTYIVRNIVYQLNDYSDNNSYPDKAKAQGNSDQQAVDATVQSPKTIIKIMARRRRSRSRSRSNSRSGAACRVQKRRSSRSGRRRRRSQSRSGGPSYGVAAMGYSSNGGGNGGGRRRRRSRSRSRS